jgi:hypothetical protein
VAFVVGVGGVLWMVVCGIVLNEVSGSVCSFALLPVCKLASSCCT